MNLFDAIIIIICIIATYRGWVDGLFRELMGFVSIFISLIVTLKFADIFTSIIDGFINTSPQILHLASFGILFLLSLVGVKIITKGIKTIIDFSFLGFIDNAAGSVFHIAKYIFIISFVLWTFTEFVTIIQFDEKFIESYFSDSITFSYVRGFAPYVIDSFSWISPYLSDLFESTKDIISTDKS